MLKQPLSERLGFVTPATHAAAGRGTAATSRPQTRKKSSLMSLSLVVENSLRVGSPFWRSPRKLSNTASLRALNHAASPVSGDYSSLPSFHVSSNNGSLMVLDSAPLSAEEVLQRCARAKICVIRKYGSHVDTQASFLHKFVPWIFGSVHYGQNLQVPLTSVFKNPPRNSHSFSPSKLIRWTRTITPLYSLVSHQQQWFDGEAHILYLIN